MRELDPSSAEHRRIEHLLQVSTPRYDITDVGVEEVEAPVFRVEYDRRSQDLSSLECFSSPLELGLQSLEGIESSGIHFGDENPMFGVGEVDLDLANDGENAEEPEMRAFELLLCRVAVGRPCPVTEDADTNEVLDHGYNSYLVLPEGAGGDSDEGFSVANRGFEATTQLLDAARERGEFRFRFVVPAAEQVLPLAVVRFRARRRREAPPPMCEACDERVAATYCKQDDALFCEQCDGEVHNTNPIMRRHVRVDVASSMKGGKRSVQAPMCPVHPSQRVEFFDPILHVPVCVHCKMVGSHATGEAATHKLVSIHVAYEEAVGASRRADPQLRQRREAIESHRASITAKLHAVRDNSAAVREEIQHAMEAAVAQLERQTEAKARALLAEEAQLQLQLTRISHAEEALARHREELGIVEFLDAWHRHAALRSELHAMRTPTPAVASTVEADLRLEGSIAVHSEPLASCPVTAEELRAGRLHQGGRAQESGGEGGDGGRLRRDMPATSPFGQRPTKGATGTPGSATVRTSLAGMMTSAVRAQQGGSGSASGAETTGGVRPSTMWTAALRENMGVSAQAQERGAAAPDKENASSPAHSDAQKEGKGVFSLSALARRRAPLLESWGGAAAEAFRSSGVLDEQAAAWVYLSCAPQAVSGSSALEATTEAAHVAFGQAPNTTCLFRADRDGFSVAALHERLAENMSQCPTVLLVRSGQHVFGGFASEYWIPDGEFRGDPRCFLFSTTRDVRVPYQNPSQRALVTRAKGATPTKGKSPARKGGKRRGRGSLATGIGGAYSSVEYESLRATQDTLEFGKGDLVIRGDFSDCESRLEGMYSLGLDSKAAKTLLAGASSFACDAVEVWGIMA